MDLKEISWGIEIETVKQTREKVARAIQSVVGGTVRHIGAPQNQDPWEVTDDRGRKWNVVADGSLTNVDMAYRAEIVSPILEYDDIPQLQEVVRAVRKAGARSSSQTGIHVHINGAVFDARALVNLAKIVNKQEDLIVKALNVNTERLARYAKKVKPDFIEKIERRKSRPFMSPRGQRTRKTISSTWRHGSSTNAGTTRRSTCSLTSAPRQCSAR